MIRATVVGLAVMVTLGLLSACDESDSPDTEAEYVSARFQETLPEPGDLGRGLCAQSDDPERSERIQRHRRKQQAQLEALIEAFREDPNALYRHSFQDSETGEPQTSEISVRRLVALQRAGVGRLLNDPAYRFRRKARREGFSKPLPFERPPLRRSCLERLDDRLRALLEGEE